MSLKDRFDKFIDYFTEDGEETTATSRAYMLANKNWLCKVIVLMKK